MGAGKTTVAAALARKFACAMIDLDRFIEEREGRTAQQIIDEDGEQRFREIESRALDDALNTSGARILALGGGAWTIARNRALVAEHHGLTIWLDAPFELCWQRIESGRAARPLARERSKARTLYDERRAHYGLAMMRVQVDDGTSARAIAEVIVAALARQTEGSDD